MRAFSSALPALSQSASSAKVLNLYLSNSFSDVRDSTENAKSKIFCDTILRDVIIVRHFSKIWDTKKKCGENVSCT